MEAKEKYISSSLRIYGILGLFEHVVQYSCMILDVIQ